MSVENIMFYIRFNCISGERIFCLALTITLIVINTPSFG